MNKTQRAQGAHGLCSRIFAIINNSSSLIGLPVYQEGNTVTPGASTSRNVPHNLGYPSQAMDQDFGVPEPLLPSFPQPTSTPPPRSPPLSPPPPSLTHAGRPKHNYRLPARYEDINPEPLEPLGEDSEDEQPTKQPTTVLPRLCLIVRNRLRTATNSFGLLREYLYRLSFDPDSFVPEKDLYQAGGTSQTSPVFMQMPPPAPVHRNESVEMIMNWKDSGAITKSDAEVNHLVSDVLLDPNFKVEDLKGFNVVRENRQSDAAVQRRSPHSLILFKLPTLKLRFHQVLKGYRRPCFLSQDYSIES